MDKPVFTLRRRGYDDVGTAVTVGDRLELEETQEYRLEFHSPLSMSERGAVREAGAEFLSDQVALLSFGNFIGRTRLLGVSIEVVSSKLGATDLSVMLEEITRLGTGLPFGGVAPLRFPKVASTELSAAIPYHQLQMLRYCALHASAGARFGDWLEAIARGPTRRFAPDRRLVPLGRLSRIDATAVRQIFSRVDRLVSVPASAPLASSALAQQLVFGQPPVAHLPAAVAAPRGRLSFDTPENRFARHVVTECLTLAQRFSTEKRIHENVRADCRRLVGTLELALSAPHLAEAGQLRGFQAPSQALLKSEGYRDLLLFWDEWTRPVALPFSADAASSLLEGRDVASLYEYWAFGKVVELVAAELHERPSSLKVSLARGTFGESPRSGFTFHFPSRVSVTFNRPFSRRSGDSYSAGFRPDVVLEIDQRLIALDAKYRLERLEVSDDADPESDATGDRATYKRADLYKMHAYRDAIRGLRSAVALYPGTEFVFFERGGTKRLAPLTIQTLDGVGAVPLRPNDPGSHVGLQEFIRVALSGR